jgi:diaminopimelate decarboxylase
VIAPATTARRGVDRGGQPLRNTDLRHGPGAAAAFRPRDSRGFPDPWIRQYSVKANDVPAIIREVAASGFGANVVSRGEWGLAGEAGLPNHRITLEGIGKTDDDLRAAVGAAADGAPLRWIAVESADEAAALARIAGDIDLGSSARLDLLLRLNPEVEAETIAGLAVGASSSKFGVRADELQQAIGAGGGPEGPCDGSACIFILARS